MSAGSVTRRGLSVFPLSFVVLAFLFFADLLTDGRFLVTDTEDVGTTLGQMTQAALDG